MSPVDLSPVLEVIERHWGFRTLRPMQERAISAVLQRRDSLVVMPTGGGKSLCYQAPATYRSDETTVVVSPLIALMKDQVDHLTAVGVPALKIDSTLSEDERRESWTKLRNGQARLLYVSPEKIVSSRFQAFLQEIGVRTFAIDEAHCISHWGHDFRPEYRQLAALRESFPDASFHAFTATATQQVRDDICEQLRLHQPEVLVGSFDRPNLTYRALRRVDELNQILAILDRHRNEAGIIYCNSRKDVDELTTKLVSLGHRARRYRAANPDEPAEVNARMRRETHDAFRSGDCDLVVATIAFGMGIDRSNIRFVLHTALSKSIEHYQQEAGRAGRDGLEAECVLLFTGADAMMWKRFAQNALEENKCDADQASHAEQMAEAVYAYASGTTCRHRFLVEHFGQPFELENCGACDICLGEIDFEPDATTVAKKIISCVARLQERYGVGHVIDVLRGRNTERISKYGHDALTTYGLLKDRSEPQLRDWINQLVHRGDLAQSTDQYPVLQLTPTSWSIMRGEHEVSLTKHSSTGKTKRSRTEEISWIGVNIHVFEALQSWRREMAAQRGVPPYTIFNDGTLRDISRVRPTTADRLRTISGIGDTRLRDFGNDILRIVREISERHELSMDNVTTEAPSPGQPEPMTAATAPYWEMFRQGVAIRDIAERMSVTTGTVSKHLCNYLRVERPAKGISCWVDSDTQARVERAAAEHGRQRLKPVFVALNEEVSYETISIVFAWIDAQSTPSRAIR